MSNFEILISLYYSHDPGLSFAFLVVALVVLVVLAYFSRKAVVLRRLKREGRKKIKDFSDGEKGKIVGKVVFAGDTISAPLSNRKCVYYHVLVEQYHSGSRGGGHWSTIIEEENFGDVVLFDGTGYALVDANDDMDYLVPDRKYTSGTGHDPTPNLKKFLERHEIDSENFLGFNKSIRYKEGVLENGEMFAVLGEGQWNETKDHGLIISTQKILVIVPAKDEKVFLSDDPEATAE